LRGDGFQSVVQVARPGTDELLTINVNLPGRHNVLNALAAVAIAYELELPDSAVQSALNNFEGVDRRLQVLGEHRLPAGDVMFIDDYGHHPTEIAATLEAVRQGWSGRRVAVVFQPHRYSRTRDLLDDFAEVLTGADQLIVTEVYPAGEEPIAGADGRAICAAVRARGKVEPVFVEQLDDLSDALSSMLADGDLLLTLGAGDIGATAQALPAALQARGQAKK
jgi:UDP-N-acetylmuramate--alanine ligase